MTWFKKAILLLLVLTGLTGCETRSKLVAKNVYSNSSSQLSLDCKDSIKSVELRQLTKNSSIALMPVAAIHATCGLLFFPFCGTGWVC